MFIQLSEYNQGYLRWLIRLNWAAGVFINDFGGSEVTVQPSFKKCDFIIKPKKHEKKNTPI